MKLISSLIAIHVSEVAVLAVSLIEFVFAVFISVFSAMATGGSIVARHLCPKQCGNAKSAINHPFWLTIVVLLLIMIFCLRDKFYTKFCVWRYFRRG